MSQPLSSATLQLTTLQMAVMINSGVHIVKVLLTLSQSPDPAVRESMTSLAQKVEGGHRLSAAMAQHPESFPPIYLRSIKVAEQSGQLAKVFQSMAEQMGKQEKLRTRLRAALTYPLCVVCLAGLMTLFLLYVQVPAFLRFFTDTGAPVPLITQLLAWLTRPEWLLLLLGGAVAGGLAWRVEGATPEGRRRQAERFYALPVLGRLLLLAELARLSQDLALMFNWGVDPITAFKTLEETPAGSPLLQDSLSRLRERLEDGVDFGEAFARDPFFPPLLVSLLRSTEETGRLDTGLSWYAALAEEELHYSIDALTGLIEPLIMAGLGSLVLLIILGSFMPMYQLLNVG